MPTSHLPPADLGTLDFPTVAEVAGVLRVSKMTVYRRCHAEEPASRRVGRCVRISSNAVRAYLGMDAAPQEAG